MRVVINAISARTGGTFTYLTNIVPQLLDVTDEAEFVLVCGTDQEHFVQVLGERPRLRFVKAPVPRTSSGRAIWQQTRLPGLLRQIEHDLLYSPNNFTVFREDAAIPIVLAIRNPNPFFASAVNYSPPARVTNFLLRELARLSARRANRIVFVSECSRQVTAKRINIPLAKTRVVYHGRSEIFSPTAPPSDEFPRPYILTVSNIYAHKNYVRLVDSFVSLKQGYGIPHHLVLLGRKDLDSDTAKIQAVIDKSSLEGFIHLPGPRPHQSLPAIYTGAELFILPSLLETFGHPLVEAMASGVPLAASNAGSNPEICDGAAVLFDPLDRQAIAVALHQLIHDQSLREQSTSRGLRRAQFFSWEKSAGELFQLFEDALNN